MKLFNTVSNAQSMRQSNRGTTAGANRHESFEYSEPVTYGEFTILAIMFMETGTYNPEFLRPYSASVSGTDIERIADVVAEGGGVKVSPDQIAGTAGRILRYSSDVDQRDLVDIENGWDCRRLSFLMEVVENGRSEFDVNGNDTVTYISGYTDRMDFVGSGEHIDLPHDLVFHLSNIHRIERATRRVQVNHQLIIPAYHERSYHNTGRDLYTARPRDVFHDEMSRELTPDAGRRLNSANRLSGIMPKTSRSTNLLPSTYIASSVNALIRGETQRGALDDGFGNYQPGRISADSVYSKAASLLDEKSPYERNSFLYLLRGKSSGFHHNSTFEWRDLTEVFGRDIKRVCSVYKRKAVTQKSTRWSEAGGSATWDDSENGGYNAVFATALKQALPSYALESMIYSCRLEATNIISPTEAHDAYSGILITVSDVVFISRMPNAREEAILIEQLREKVANYILRDLSLDNQLDFDIVVDLDWRNDSFFSISINGGRMVEFSSASFSNALTSPIITPNDYMTQDLASDLKSIVRSILGN